MEKNIDLSGLFPPINAAQEAGIFGAPVSGLHTYAPVLVSEQEFTQDFLPKLSQELPTEMVSFIRDRVAKTFALRNKLQNLAPQIRSIVGKGNLSFLWLDREAYSADSMEHRALVSEAVIHVYSAPALQKLVKLLYENDVPMIPYGEGGGYNMGVTPMAPAVSISLRGINHITPIKPSRRTPGSFEITVGAGVPFKDVVNLIARHGYILRCDPNTPRAASGGIAASGSNGGRKAFEVILHGRAITAAGVAVTFAADAEEIKLTREEPFLLTHKFFGVQNADKFAAQLRAFTSSNSVALVEGEANSAAGDEGNSFAEINNLSPLSLSSFVGAEGCTGFIYEVTFEIEKPLDYVRGFRWHFANIEHAMELTKKVKACPLNEQPVYFEFISGPSIRRYLLEEFPGVFPENVAATIIAVVEGATAEECTMRSQDLESFVPHALKTETTAVLINENLLPQIENLKLPREELPKKLRTKCKTDMEIRTEYLPAVLELLNSEPLNQKWQKEDVLFGHLTPSHTAIMHWNIGGFDLYAEDEADAAWEYLERVINKAQHLAPEGDEHGSARFTGEHGLAGKAAFLWLNNIPESEFNRICHLKNLLDPKNLYNPETIYLKTSHARSLRARLLTLTSKTLGQARDSSKYHAAEQHVETQALLCTRCNSCKVCPVFDTEHLLESRGERASTKSVLPSKRNLIMFLEYIVMARRVASVTGRTEQVEKITSEMLAESEELLAKCFYCRKCDKACPMDIMIHPLMQAYFDMGALPGNKSSFWEFITDRLMGQDFFKNLTYKILSFILILSSPILKFMRGIKQIPTWIKTYLAPPGIVFNPYQPLNTGFKQVVKDNFIVFSGAEISGTSNSINKVFLNDKFDNKNSHTRTFVQAHPKLPAGTLYVRFRGCFDTYGNPKASAAVDTYFTEFLGASFIDLEKRICCGFPYEADGHHAKAKAQQIDCLVEIAQAVHTLWQEGSPCLVTLFSNCPTCNEALREMRELLHNEETYAQVANRAKLTPNFPAQILNYRVADTAELAMEILAVTPEKATKIEQKKTAVGLKIPCHNSKEATKAQLTLLRKYFTSVFGYDNCCGLSGIGRLKHPRIGTGIAEQLREQIAKNSCEVCVSGCPSCRDGVKMQRDVVTSGVRDYKVKGIFEQITGI